MRVLETNGFWVCQRVNTIANSICAVGGILSNRLHHCGPLSKQLKQRTHVQENCKSQEMLHIAVIRHFGEQREDLPDASHTSDWFDWSGR